MRRIPALFAWLALAVVVACSTTPATLPEVRYYAIADT